MPSGYLRYCRNTEGGGGRSLGAALNLVKRLIVTLSEVMNFCLNSKLVADVFNMMLDYCDHLLPSDSL